MNGKISVFNNPGFQSLILSANADVLKDPELDTDTKLKYHTFTLLADHSNPNDLVQAWIALAAAKIQDNQIWSTVTQSSNPKSAADQQCKAFLQHQVKEYNIQLGVAGTWTVLFSMSLLAFAGLATSGFVALAAGVFASTGACAYLFNEYKKNNNKINDASNQRSEITHTPDLPKRKHR